MDSVSKAGVRVGVLTVGTVAITTAYVYKRLDAHVVLEPQTKESEVKLINVL